MSLQFHQQSRTWTYGARAALTFRSSSRLPVRTVPASTGVMAFLQRGGHSISRTGAVKVTGSPFNTFADAEAACNTTLRMLKQADRGTAQANNAAPPSVNFR